ncbi:guanylate kinase [Candidatus Gracilibacteria bacterium]|nr:guanylate kinase [Candidatus Gracilibacteria bacterium]
MKGKLILILGPSGSGKGTLINYVKTEFPNFVFPVSCTTRAMRPGEIAGDVYHFISKAEFQAKIAADEFLEYAIVHGDNYYGTLKSQILEPLAEGKTVFREVDIQGVQSLQKLIPKDKLKTIFIKTSKINDWEELKRRITSRAEISNEELEQRYKSYLTEIEFADMADQIIYNENLDHAKNDLKNTILQFIAT